MKQMKKYLAIFAVLFTVILSSCSNDDIPVNQSITFKVNPSTVVNCFAEYDAGELTVLPKGYSLRVRLLIYNEAGVLVSSDTQKFNDYSHIMTSPQDLPEGEYTVVTTTDIITSTDENFAWRLSNEENLSTLSIAKSEYIREQWEILGLETTHVSIYPGIKDVNIDVKPAGALAIVFYTNWNHYSDVVKYKLNSDRIADNLTFTSTGEPQYSVKSSNWTDYRISLATWDSNYIGAYRYIFLFPMQNATFQFKCECDDDKTYLLGEPAKINTERGKEYRFEIDVETDEASWYVITPRSSKAVMDKMPFLSGQCNASTSIISDDLIKDFTGYSVHK